MSDTPTSVNSMVPDAETIARVHERHLADLASYDAQNPNSPVYGRPDLAAQMRERAEAEYAASCARWGISKPEAPTLEQQREQAFEAQWNLELGDRQSELLDEQLEREEALTPAERQFRAAALKKELGEAEYAQLVEQAKAAVPAGVTFPPEMLSNRFLLLNAAAVGRYIQAYGRARAAAGFGS